jgi:putative endonuclease
MDQNNKERGDEGERLAREHLAARGYEILETNWRYRRYEIDIVSRIGDTIVFVEVKTRKSGTFGEPEIFVDRRKQRNLVAAANFFLQDRDIELEARFDIIAIMPASEGGAVNHIENAFYPVVK